MKTETRKHPDYPVRPGNPAMDRCTCGGVRHWHALAPRGCDDCDCREFVLDAEATANARTKFRARVVDHRDHYSDVAVFAGPEGNSANVGRLTMLHHEANDFVEALRFASEAQDVHGSVTL